MRSKNAIYNIISNLLLQIIVIVYGFIVPKIIISSFGSDVNGLISSITQFLAYITLLESGFGPVIKAALYKPIAKKDNKTIKSILKTSEKFFRRIAIIFLIYILALLIFYPILITKDFDYLFTASLIIIISISTFVEYFFGMTYKLYLQAEQKNYIVSIIQIVTYILNIILIIILAKFGSSIQIIKLFSTLAFVLRPIIQNMYIKKKYKLHLYEASGDYKLNQKWDALAMHIASVIHGNTDITVLTIFCSLSEVSVYSVYYLVVKGIKAIIQSFSMGIDAIFGDMIAKNEQKNLNSKFNTYEVLYFSLCTILFVCAMILIVPFVLVYTRGIKDVNYIRWTFGYLIVISEFIWAIRLPYSTLTSASGHFKQVRRGAWVEAILNIVISIILVRKYGIIGVAIGTIVAMTIRTIEFMYHTNRVILNRNIFKSISKVILIIIETIISVIFSKYLFIFDNTSYFNWLLNALIIFIFVSLVTFIINLIFYKKEFLTIFKMIKNNIIKRKK